MIIPNNVLLLKSQSSDDEPDKYEQLLRSNNFEVTLARTLVFTFKDLNKLSGKLRNSAHYSGLIFSSPRCVSAVYLAAENRNILDEWKEKINFVAGEATYKRALDQLGLDCYGKEAGNAANLSKIIVKDKSSFSKPFLFPHGNLKSDTLNVELSKEGLELDGTEVYDTVQNPELENELAKVTNNFTAISEYVVFFSPSGVSNSIDFLARLPIDLNTVKFIALGPVTELSLTERNLPVYGVAKQPNPEEILKIIVGK